MFRKIAIAIAFSPRQQALLAEGRRLQQLFGAQLLLVHVGERTPDKEAELQRQLSELAVEPQGVSVFWEEGDAAQQILALSRGQGVDLLLAGALKKENLIRYYIGSVARKILRQATFPVLMLIEPQRTPRPFKRIVIHAGTKEGAPATIKAGCGIARLEAARQVHIVKDVKMWGLTMALAGEAPEHEYSDTRRSLLQDQIDRVQRMVDQCDECRGLRINIKVAAGKSGYELSKFSRQAEADLLVTETPHRNLNIFDRMFSHDLEYLLADLPTNLLLVPQE
ncbi:universal stress protein [Cesiribacter andamanensis]|uniref:Universal stress protein family protein n=1 Tax=Cesiribacter andamanensis AMV16 TaxID=1279009 RepID=M7P0X4_9BACT|nr:universal stress protein [Cesiribacter andamanensis]EMR04234.1 Universal stress protein family protein [Cesiribacter andamanensis AMV16]